MQRQYSLLLGAALTLLGLLAGCGGEASPSAALGAAESGGSVPTIAATATANIAAGDVLIADTATPTATNADGSSAAGTGIDVASFDVCSLLSKEEVLELMPDAEYDGFLSDFDAGSGSKACTLADTEGKGYLQLVLYTPDRWDDEAKHTGPNPQPVAGLGDDAVSESLKYTQVLAVLVKGRAAFLLTVNPIYPPDYSYDVEQASTIAQQFTLKIVPRLR